MKSPNPIPGAKFVINTQNKKLIGCAATYVSQATCPPSCPLLGNGCYAERGPIAWMTTDKLAKTTLAPNEIIYKEAELISQNANLLEAFSRPLRLHVVGDFHKATKALAHLVNAAHNYILKTKASVFTYTHCWRDIARGKFGKISILASCESEAQVAEAHASGYAPALIVPRFPAGPRAFPLENGFTCIPCPWQTLGVGCRACGLCSRDRWLWQTKRVIGFVPHGVRKAQVLGVIKNC